MSSRELLKSFSVLHGSTARHHAVTEHGSSLKQHASTGKAGRAGSDVPASAAKAPSRIRCTQATVAATERAYEHARPRPRRGTRELGTLIKLLPPNRRFRYHGVLEYRNPPDPKKPRVPRTDAVVTFGRFDTAEFIL